MPGFNKIHQFCRKALWEKKELDIWAVADWQRLKTGMINSVITLAVTIARLNSRRHIPGDRRRYRVESGPARPRPLQV